MKLIKINIIAFAITLLFSIGTVANANTPEPRTGIIETTRERIENKFEKNKDIRNERAEERKELKASTTTQIKDIRKERKDEISEIRASSTIRIKEIREEKREEMKLIKSSTTIPFKVLKNEKGEIIKKMQLNAYESRKKALLSELNATFKNLTIIRDRITDRISKLSNDGKDTTKANEELLIANDKIAKAKIAIELFANLPSPSTNIASSTSEISIEKPRKVGDDAIKAIKDAKDALRKVLELMPKLPSITASSTNPIK